MKTMNSRSPRQLNLFPKSDKDQLFEFLIVITPSTEIIANANALKSEFLQMYDFNKAMNSFWVNRLTVPRRDSYGGRYSQLMDLKPGN